MSLGGEEALGRSGSLCGLERAGRRGSAQQSTKSLPERIRHRWGERERVRERDTETLTSSNNNLASISSISSIGFGASLFLPRNQVSER